MERLKNMITRKRMLLLPVLLMFCICPLSVSLKAADIQLNKSKLTMAVGGSYQLKLENNTKKTIWSASNSKVTVSQKGKVTAEKTGKAVVTVKAGKKKYTCKISEVNTSDTATVQIIMRTRFKGSPIRVNAQYYISLFRDRKLKNRMVTSAFDLKNASTCTKTFKVFLGKTVSRKITLYAAETDKDGIPLKAGKISGYQIMINNKDKNLYGFTLSKGNLAEKITITNRIL